MKQISELSHSVKQPHFISEQFTRSNTHKKKNILFISPILSGRHLYRYIMPYLILSKHDCARTAITGLNKYDPDMPYSEIEAEFGTKEILWADVIVFPFTTQNLKPLYEYIREVNPTAKIFYSIDFNFYLVHKWHPYHETFKDDSTILTIEDNIFNCDIALFSNYSLLSYVELRLIESKKLRHSEAVFNCHFQWQPLFIDEAIVTENVHDDSLMLEREPEEILRIGIIATEFNWVDIYSYKNELEAIQKKHGGKVTFVLIGFNGLNSRGETCLPVGFEFQEVEKCTIVHYFKALCFHNLDAIFIPRIANDFNDTSENYNKFLEAGIFNLPIIVSDIFPYNSIQEAEKENYGDFMFVMKKEGDLVELIDHAVQNPQILKERGQIAYQVVNDIYTFHEGNLPILDRMFS